jgi:hypothetical protein
MAVHTAFAQPPLCDAGGPYSGHVQELIQFDGSRSRAVPPHVIVLFEWDFGDGDTATGVMPTHAYEAPGVYVIELLITDDDAWQSQCFAEAEVTSPTPVEPENWGRIKARYRD